MNQNKQLWLLMLLFVAVLLGGVLGTGFSAVSSTQARQTSTQQKEKWEYCAIIAAGSTGYDFGRYGGRAVIRYFDLNGSREEPVDVKVEKSVYDFNPGHEAAAQAIAKLGNEGWEMVSRESSQNKNGYDFIYFKRLKP